MLKRLTAVAATALAVVAATLAVAAPAQAHPGGPPAGEPLACYDTYAVYSCFEVNGDDFWVYDEVSDGNGAVASWGTNYGRSGWCRNSHGAGTWHECTYDMREGECVRWLNLTYDVPTATITYQSAVSEWVRIGAGGRCS